MSEIKKGGISVETEHIFPIIKRWLYSDKEIFLRELVSNACDAITKQKRLVSLNEAESDNAPYRINVTLDPDASTLTIEDNGLGMSEEEISKYINQIALSGALDFIEKYEKENDDGGIIGHFGLGFYSAFMVADTVEIYSKSYTDAPAVHWTCNEAGEFEMEECDKSTRGTQIVLHVTEEEKEFLAPERILEILRRYCAFMTTEIYFKNTSDTEEKEEKPVNNPAPLWTKSASECTKDEYNNFYRELFSDWNEPLFSIHINADYPLNFKGILYFPRLSHEYSNLEGQVKLFYNQVFVADNIKEVIPEYLLMLKGVLDCPELPLNVSRSYLQNSGYVSKISAHIVKKVCDKITSLMRDDRENYEKMWDDVKPFIEYGCLKDKKFYDRTKGACLFKTVNDKYLTLDEYLENNKVEENKVFYSTDKTAQAGYIKLLKEQGIDVVVLDTMMDTQFISFIEHENEKVSFIRCDAEISSSLKTDGETVKNEVLLDLFKKVAGEKVEVELVCLKDTSTPAVLTLSEQDRRFSDMMKMYSKTIPTSATVPEKLLVNTANAAVLKIETLLSNPDKHALCETLAEQVYTLALISQRQLTGEEMEKFIKANVQMISTLY